MSDYVRHPNTVCIICNKPIYKRKYQITLNKGKVFCSSACYGFSLREEKPCTICGKLILAGANKRTCSRACSNKLRIGSKYRTNDRKDKVKSYKRLKIRLLRIRGNNCERCRYNKFEILQVHHKDKNHSNNELKNLELICPNCHYEEHYLKSSWLNKLKNHGEVA
jgi:hypothetical protein